MHASIYALIAICLAATPNPTTQPTRTLSDPQPTGVSYLPRTAVIMVDGKTWTFQPGPNNHGLRLQIGCAEHAQSIDLGLDQIVGEVIGIAAAVQDARSPQSNRFIGLALECLSPDGKSREYRMAFGRCPAGQITSAQKGNWIASGILTTRPNENPFNAASVSLIGGDSIMVTLQKLTRSLEDQIESHVFVNHCPTGNARNEMFDNITTHFIASPANHTKAPAAQPK